MENRPNIAPPGVVHDRFGLEVLSPEACWELVRSSPVGRVAFVDAGEPVVLPVNHFLVAHHIVFRSSSGSKLGAATMRQPVAFEVDGWDATAHAGWSVLVEGVADHVTDVDELESLDKLDLQPWPGGAHWTEWVRISPNEISGRRLG